MNKSILAFSLVAMSVALVSCTKTVVPPQSTSTPLPNLPPATQIDTQPTTTSSSYTNFSDWKQDFYRRAVAQGASAQAMQRLLAQANYSSSIISLDRQQPEFSKMPWSYAQSMQSKVSLGQQKFAGQRDLLLDLEAQYGVPASIITAIWGIESSYGAGTGNSDLPSALATLAYDGRRREWAEQQLMAMAHLLQRGDLSWTHLKGSWAGGMGHTQFIPTTWQNYGVDGNQDGHRNPWTMADALASTANYLSKSGWVRGVNPYYEVTLPTGFDYKLSGTKQSFAQWQRLGVNFVSDTPPLLASDAELWLPAGANGPALLLSKNFEVIRVYNNSSSYALAVSMLAKSIVNKPTVQRAWPQGEQALSTYQVQRLQQRLTVMGFDTKGTDGVLGTNTRKAFQQWQIANGQLADGFVSVRTASALIY